MLITGDQLWKLLVDYGPTVAFIVFIIIVIVGIFVIWKPVTKFVTAVNNILALPARLDEQDKVAQEKKGLIEEVQASLTQHIAESAVYVTEIGLMKKEIGAVAMQQQDIIHEVKPNHGSSMKDQLDRIENKIFPELLRQVDDLAKQAVTAADAAALSATTAAEVAAEAKEARPKSRTRRKVVALPEAADSTDQP